MTHVAIAVADKVEGFVAEDHCHIITSPGFYVEDWMSVAVELMGGRHSELPWVHLVYPDGTEMWTFAFE